MLHVDNYHWLHNRQGNTKESNDRIPIYASVCWQQVGSFIILTALLKDKIDNVYVKDAIKCALLPSNTKYSQ